MRKCCAYAVAGQMLEARGILAEMRESFDRDYAEPYAMAAVFVALGDADETFRWLERAWQDRTSLFSLWVNGDPRFDLVSADPRMNALLDRIAVKVTASSGRLSS